MLKGHDKNISLSTLSFNAMESEVIGKGELNLQKQVPEWELKIGSDKLNLKPVANLINEGNFVDGYASVNSVLFGILKNSEFNISSGSVLAQANNLFINGVDVDKVLNDFENSQSVGLLDVGAIALLGPAGMLVTKGNDYRVLVKSLKSTGTSKLSQINSDISFSNGIAIMNDVAFSSERHRLAIRGKINTLDESFINFEVATVDKQGCSIYKEQVKGNLDSPSVKEVNILVSGVLNPINSVVSKVTKTLKVQCKKPFYSGVVKYSIN